MLKGLPFRQGLSAALRAATLGIRFGLVLYLARHLPLADVGLFALYWGGVQLSAGLIPLDVYAHSTRCLLEPTAKMARILGQHLGFLLAAIVCFGPVAAYIFSKSSSSVSAVLAWFLLMSLVFEVLAVDLGRLLVPLHKPLEANCVLFIRSGLWVIPLIGGNELGILDLDLNLTIAFWICGSALAAAVAVFFATRATGSIPWPVFDRSWLSQALRSIGWFFAATMLFRAMLGFDRFLVEHFLGTPSLAIYSVFASVALGVLGLLESGVSAWHFPRLVRALQSNESDCASETLRAFARDNLRATAALAVVLGAAFPLVSWFYLSREYQSELHIFFLIHLGVILYCLSMPYHYVLYGLRRDRTLVIIYAIGLTAMMLCAVLAMPPLGLVGAGMMLLVGLASIAVGRFVSFKIITSRKFGAGAISICDAGC